MSIFAWLYAHPLITAAIQVVLIVVGAVAATEFYNRARWRRQINPPPRGPRPPPPPPQRPTRPPEAETLVCIRLRRSIVMSNPSPGADPMLVAGRVVAVPPEDATALVRAHWADCAPWPSQRGEASTSAGETTIRLDAIPDGIRDTETPPPM